MKIAAGRLLFPIGLSFLLFYSCAPKDKEQPVQGDDMLKDSVTIAFFKRISTGCLVNIEQTDLAMRKSASPDVRKISERINEQQKSLFNDLVELGTTKKQDLPDSLTSNRKKRIASLEIEEKKEFDKKILTRINSELRLELKAMKSVESNNDSDIKGFAARYVPQIQASLDSLRSLRNEKYPATRAVKKKKTALKK